jgi:dTDP-4-dehydrorhamnose reductase
MRILLLGGNGQVGHELRRSLAPLGELVVTTRDGVVVNATAHTAVDRAESEPELAMRINAEAPARLAEVCTARGARLVHYSTDYVFDGTATTPYREDDATSPLGSYGRSKLAGERSIQASGAEHLILRTAWVYGLHGHNFLKTMLRLAGERDELRIVADQIGSPTPAWLIADITAELVRGGSALSSGVRHLVCSGSTSWHGFAEAIVAEASSRGLTVRRPAVVPIGTLDFPTPARRPGYSVLDTALLQADLGRSVPEWRHALSLTFSRGASSH